MGNELRCFTEYINKIKNQINSLNEITNNLLSYDPDKINLGQVESVRNLSNQLQETIDNLR